MKFTRFSRPISQTREGSALLVTLLVISLMLVTVLTFTQVVRMELRKVISHQEMLQAKGNARLGAELALAQIQHLLGPDQRVSAPADVLRGSEGNLYRPSLNRHANKRHWVGVWDADGFDERSAANKPFLGWLVSGPPAESAEQDLSRVSSAPTGTNLVALVGEGSVERPEDGITLAPTPLTNAVGTYAYWVSDEGTKARFNLQDPFRGTSDFTERQFSMKSAQRHAAELFTYDNVNPLSSSGLYPLDDDGFTEMRERLANIEQLPLIPPAGSAAAGAYRQLYRNRFHDMTLVSRGVLADVRNGGLKTDLSLAFEMPLAEFNQSEFGAGSPYAEDPVHRPPGYPANEKITPMFRISDFTPFGFEPENSPNRGTYNSTHEMWANPQKNIAPVLRGPPWHLLRNYYRIYKQNDPDRGAYGLNQTSFVTSGGRQVYQGRGFFPEPVGFSFARRYAQDPHVWTYAQGYGPLGTNLTSSLELGRPIFPAISPVPLRVQVVTSLRMRPHTVTDEEGETATHYIPDVYIDPIVVLWNPYNVPVRTGTQQGQPLQISVRFIDFIMDLETDGTSNKVRLRNLFKDSNGSHLSYDPNSSEAFMLTLDDGGSGLVLEPGEVVIFTGTAQSVTYERIPGSDSFQVYSGVNLNMRPGIVSYLPEDSGILFEDPWELSLPAETSVRFQTTNVNVDPMTGQTVNLIHKFQFGGVSRNLPSGNPSGISPFFSSAEAGGTNMNTAWSASMSANSAELVDEKRPFFLYDAMLKSENSDFPVNMLAQYNVRAATFDQGLFTNSESMKHLPSTRQDDLWLGRSFRLQFGWDSLFSTHISTEGSRGAFWGGGPTSSSGSPRVTLFEIPRLPPLSLASLQHAQVLLMGDEPSFAIGNSILPIFVRPGEKISSQALNNRTGSASTFPNNLRVWNEARSPRSRNPWTMTRPDWSYLLNETLWDGYYLSSISPINGFASAHDSFAALQEGQPLPNSTLRAVKRPGETEADVRDKLFHSGGNREIRGDAPRLVSENLLVEGAFNVNSTSVEAWRALLSSTRNLIINLQDQPQPRELDGTAFTRTALPFDFEDDKWHGFRNLTDAQIDRLARELVLQVQTRGPFLNLGDFINRRLAPSGHASQRSGPLQSAIDAAGLNDSFNVTLQSRGYNANNITPHVAPQVQPGSPVAMNAPGWLNQADILTLIGPLLSARADTFTIRAYGEHAGSRAWCEMVVQRVPEYVDSTRKKDQPARWDPSETPPDSDSYDTTTPRRRFIVTQFRWLNPEDV
ncbi:MAG: hypothetical protein JJU29_09365 [Verrucomicrobia bacterium]|nr:hypothetical protein [Verrucomicrobiota bacterium]MCH8511720.1 hypothetical protein [Kiritimatiellia bacterium]